MIKGHKEHERALFPRVSLGVARSLLSASAKIVEQYWGLILFSVSLAFSHLTSLPCKRLLGHCESLPVGSQMETRMLVYTGG